MLLETDQALQLIFLVPVSMEAHWRSFFPASKIRVAPAERSLTFIETPGVAVSMLSAMRLMTLANTSRARLRLLTATDAVNTDVNDANEAVPSI